MSEKTGAVTRLAEAMLGVAFMGHDNEVAAPAVAEFLEKRADDMAELDYDRLRALDLVAESADLRELVTLAGALSAGERVVLLDILRRRRPAADLGEEKAQ